MRHSPQRASPYGVSTRSPHTAHRRPPIGAIPLRQWSQTGSREILVRGAWQRRQSEGNSVANRLCAAVWNSPARASPGDPWPLARLRLLLLKTALLVRHSRPEMPGIHQKTFLSIARYEPGAQCGRNSGSGSVSEEPATRRFGRENFPAQSGSVASNPVHNNQGETRV